MIWCICEIWQGAGLTWPFTLSHTLSQPTFYSPQINFICFQNQRWKPQEIIEHSLAHRIIMPALQAKERTTKTSRISLSLRGKSKSPETGRCYWSWALKQNNFKETYRKKTVGGMCGWEVNTLNSRSGGPGFKPRPLCCFLRQGTLLHFVSLYSGL